MRRMDRPMSESASITGSARSHREAPGKLPKTPFSGATALFSSIARRTNFGPSIPARRETLQSLHIERQWERLY